MIIYLAGPLFTLAERQFNEAFAEALERALPPCKVVLPQRYGDALSGALDFPQRMCRYSLDSIDGCDAVVAVLDGADADSGTCVEIGYARGKGKVVVGVRTDFRALEDRGVNLMVANVCSDFVVRPSFAVDISQLAEEAAARLALFHPSRRCFGAQGRLPKLRETLTENQTAIHETQTVRL